MNFKTASDHFIQRQLDSGGAVSPELAEMYSVEHKLQYW